MILVFVSILESVGYLLNIGDDGRQRDMVSFGMALAQGAIGTIVHYEEGETIGDVKVEDAHDVGMNERRNGLGLLLKSLDSVPLRDEHAAL